MDNETFITKEEVNAMLYTKMPDEMTLKEFEEISIKVFALLDVEISRWNNLKNLKTGD